ncbi:MAG: ribosome maturation factor RimP [Bacillota bacterium]
MGKNRVADAAAGLAVPLVEECGLELVDVEYVREGGRWYLRVYIDKPGGVNVDDCELVSRRLDSVLDTTDFIPNPYTLEVSSPGIERPLKKPSDFQRYTGKRVSLTTFVPVEGQRRFKGILGPATDHSLTLDVDGQEVVVPMEQVASARLSFEF